MNRRDPPISIRSYNGTEYLIPLEFLDSYIALSFNRVDTICDIVSMHIYNYSEPSNMLKASFGQFVELMRLSVLRPEYPSLRPDPLVPNTRTRTSDIRLALVDRYDKLEPEIKYIVDALACMMLEIDTMESFEDVRNETRDDHYTLFIRLSVDVRKQIRFRTLMLLGVE